MCDQRERLIDYVYDEGDPAARAEVQRHLDQCPDCRAEIAALRRVRTDLLAWEVPAHEPVWRPFATAPVVPWWKQVPAWAMAAAAGVMFLLGATGSVVAQAVMPGRPVASQAANVAQPIATPAVTAADLSAAEARLLARLNQQVGEVGARVDRASYRSNSLQSIEGDHGAMTQELVRLRQAYRDQLDVIASIQRSLEDLRSTSAETHSSMNQRIKNISSYLGNPQTQESGK